MFKIGEFIEVNGSKLLVLDIIDGNPFVIDLYTDITTRFSDNGNDYRDSILHEKMSEYYACHNFNYILREIDLITMDGYEGYGSLRGCVHPLTFDEYRKYAKIINPHLTGAIWLATGWNHYSNNCPYVCIVASNGIANWTTYYSSYGLAPAFILRADSLPKSKENSLSKFTTEELLGEIAKRANR